MFMVYSLYFTSSKVYLGNIYMKRMLFNATHAEETRVAIIDGQKLVDIDIEVSGHESRKSNIYKGIITRIEPSLEACFIDYGDTKHGFLSFKEVSKQYFKYAHSPSSAKIQEVLSVGQELLVQIEKEERGNKGAALTSFISLAGRYMVLMPNNPRGGGVSRRIDGEDRAELRALMDQLQVPEGMGVIARTAAIDRNLEELQWDLNYLLQLWKAIDGAGKAKGAFLIYQESSLIIRAIRDYFSSDIRQILIDNEDIYEQARQFVGYVMPDMVERVVRYDEDIPLFTRFQIEHQIETAHSRQVPLPSGGSIVIDHTEALVAIDVNSARSTRGGDIEETATRTNLEAAEESARQLRLRDLGGLVVIDFIDMEESKNQRAVESKLKECLRYDRARLQMGKISRFGLMELSRQRLRPSLVEGSHTACPRCNGIGSIRDVNSTALHILRLVQEEARKEGTAALHVQVPVDVATFLLNEKRSDLASLESKLNVSVILIPNRHIETPYYKLERLKQDDSRLDFNKPTHTLVDTPQEHDLSKSKPPIKLAQTAKVIHITPPQREYKDTHVQVQQSGNKADLWAKVKAFFIGKNKDKKIFNKTLNQTFNGESSNTLSQKDLAYSLETKQNKQSDKQATRSSKYTRQERPDNIDLKSGQRVVNTVKNKLVDEQKSIDQSIRQDKTDRLSRSERSYKSNKYENVAKETVHIVNSDIAIMEKSLTETKSIRDKRDGRSSNSSTNKSLKTVLLDSPLNDDLSNNAALNVVLSDSQSTVNVQDKSIEKLDKTTRSRSRRNHRTRHNRDDSTEYIVHSKNESTIKESMVDNNLETHINHIYINDNKQINSINNNDNIASVQTNTNTTTGINNNRTFNKSLINEKIIGDINFIDTRDQLKSDSTIALIEPSQISETNKTNEINKDHVPPLSLPIIHSQIHSESSAHSILDNTILDIPQSNIKDWLNQPINAIQLDEKPLQSLSKEVGLEWVNTDPDALIAAQSKILNRSKSPRVLRERPVKIATVEEPLEMMETRKPS